LTALLPDGNIALIAPGNFFSVIFQETVSFTGIQKPIQGPVRVPLTVLYPLTHGFEELFQRNHFRERLLNVDRGTGKRGMHKHMPLKDCGSSYMPSKYIFF